MERSDVIFDGFKTNSSFATHLKMSPESFNSQDMEFSLQTETDSGELDLNCHAKVLCDIFAQFHSMSSVSSAL